MHPHLGPSLRLPPPPPPFFNFLFHLPSFIFHLLLRYFRFQTVFPTPTQATPSCANPVHQPSLHIHKGSFLDDLEWFSYKIRVIKIVSPQMYSTILQRVKYCLTVKMINLEKIKLENWQPFPFKKTCHCTIEGHRLF